MSGGGYVSTVVHDTGWKNKKRSGDLLSMIDNASFHDFRMAYIKEMIGASVPFTMVNFDAIRSGLENNIRGHSLDDPEHIAKTFNNQLRFHKHGYKWSRTSAEDDDLKQFSDGVRVAIKNFRDGRLTPYEMVGKVLIGFKQLKSSVAPEPGFTLKCDNQEIRTLCGRLFALCTFEKLKKKIPDEPLMSSTPGDTLLEFIKSANRIGSSLPVNELDIVSDIHFNDHDMSSTDLPMVMQAISQVLRESKTTIEDGAYLWLSTMHMHHETYEHCNIMSSNYIKSLTEDLHVLTATEKTFDRELLKQSLSGEKKYNDGRGWTTELYDKNESDVKSEMSKIVAVMASSNVGNLGDYNIEDLMEDRDFRNAVFRHMLKINPTFLGNFNKLSDEWLSLAKEVFEQPEKIKALINLLDLSSDILSPMRNQMIIGSSHDNDEILPEITMDDIRGTDI